MTTKKNNVQLTELNGQRNVEPAHLNMILDLVSASLTNRLYILIFKYKIFSSTPLQWFPFGLLSSYFEVKKILCLSNIRRFDKKLFNDGSIFFFDTESEYYIFVMATKTLKIWFGFAEWLQISHSQNLHLSTAMANRGHWKA